MITCKQCGKELPANTGFCIFCGVPVTQSPDQTPPVAPTAPPASPIYTAPPIQHPATRYTFLNSFLGLIMVVLMLIVPSFLGMKSVIFLDPNNIANIAVQIYYYGLLALAVALTARAKGPDISVGAQMVFSGVVASRILTVSGSLATGILVAIAVCAVIGALNGLVSVLLRVPALIVTGVMYLAIWAICKPLASGLDMAAVMASLKTLAIPSWARFLMMLTAFIGIFLMTLLTRFHRSIYDRDKSRSAISIIAYVVSSILAVLAGLLLLSRIKYPIQSPSYSNLLYPLFITGFITCSRLFDNGFMPAIMALLGTGCWVVLQNALNILNVSSYWQLIAESILLGAFGALALVIWFSQRKAAKTLS